MLTSVLLVSNLNNDNNYFKLIHPFHRRKKKKYIYIYIKKHKYLCFFII